MEHDLTAHFWICPTLTASESCVFELLVKGYTVTQISESRSRSAKTVSIQKRLMDCCTTKATWISGNITQIQRVSPIMFLL